MFCGILPCPGSCGLFESPKITCAMCAFHCLTVCPLKHSPPGPSVRYSHGVAVVNQGMLVTHGYYYSHPTNKAMWLDDMWWFSFEKEVWLTGRSSAGVVTAVS